jgi:DNA-binding transcriptional LysR family regulator
MNFSNLDLNLLKALDMLLAERNVTRAAHRLNLSQPALSAQLARLREVLGDPLLARSHRGMAPTALGQELAGPLRTALDGLRRVVEEGSRFDPTQSDMTVTIAASDYVQSAVLIPFLLNLHDAAPGLRIGTRIASGSALADEMERGDVDLGLVAPELVPDGLQTQTLFEEEYVCLARVGHPTVREEISFELLETLEFVGVSTRGGPVWTPFDTMLKSRGLRRRVAISVSHFLIVPELVANSDLVACLPKRLPCRANAKLRIVGFEAPIPGFSIAMVWHPRTHSHPGHRWIRAVLVAAVAEPAKEMSSKQATSLETNSE